MKSLIMLERVLTISSDKEVQFLTNQHLLNIVRKALHAEVKRNLNTGRYTPGSSDMGDMASYYSEHIPTPISTSALTPFRYFYSEEDYINLSILETLYQNDKTNH